MAQKSKSSKIISALVPIILVIVIAVISISPYVLSDKYVFDLGKAFTKIISSTEIVEFTGQSLMLSLEVDALNQDSFDQTWTENGKEYRYEYEMIESAKYYNLYDRYEKYDDFGNWVVYRKKVQSSVLGEIITVVEKGIHYLGFIVMPFTVLISAIPLILRLINPNTWFVAIA